VQGVGNSVADREFIDRVPELERMTLRAAVMREIDREFTPYRIDETKGISGHTEIYKDLSVDSLAVMDIILDLEDHFDVALPIGVVAEIRTAAELANAILAQRARH
jgi:acyl carrier protein